MNFRFRIDGVSLYLLSFRLKVDKPVVRLGLASSPSVGAPLTIVGFGLTSEGGQNSAVLREGRVNYMDMDECARILEGVNEINPDIMLCAEGSGVDA